MNSYIVYQIKYSVFYQFKNVHIVDSINKTLIIFFLAVRFQSIANAQDQVANPNILIILLDDAGYKDFGFMRSEDILTPNIDRISQNGTIFTDAHATASVCSPSRAGIITGRYQQSMGFEANGTGTKDQDIGLSDGATTIADVFQRSGYATYLVGKWHLGSSPSDHPNQRGFDHFYGFLGGSRSYFPMSDLPIDQRIQYNGVEVPYDGYLTDVLGDKAVSFLKDSDKPFFMFLSFNAPHTPMHAKAEDLEKFKRHPRQKLAAMTWSVDQNVGRILDTLTALKMLDNTLIYFLSDNGGAHENQSSVGEIKGWKGNEFEGGHRVPFVVSWPAGLVPKGKTYDGLVSSLDIFKTSIVAAKINDPNLKLDGVDILPFIKGVKEGNPHTFLHWRKLNKYAIRMNEYKWVGLNTSNGALYNLNSDIGEQQDIQTTKHGKRVLKKMMKQYRRWEKTIQQPLWDEDQVWVDIVDHITSMLLSNQKPLYRDPWEQKDLLKSNRK